MMTRFKESLEPTDVGVDDLRCEYCDEFQFEVFMDEDGFVLRCSRCGADVSRAWLEHHFRNL